METTPPTFIFAKNRLIVAPGVPCEVEVARASDFGKNVWAHSGLASENRDRMKLVEFLSKALLSCYGKIEQSNIEVPQNDHNIS